MKETGLYIHVPYCRNKCLYCDFYSGGASVAQWKRYVDAILEELRQRKGEMDHVPSTLYIGGGTPSLLPSGEFRRLIKGIRDMAGVNSSWEEFTIELNPDDVTAEMCTLWKEAGVTRVSMGIQSFNDDELRRIGRRHDSKKATEAYYLLRKDFDNISIDLMFGLPGQTIESWEKTVKRGIELNPEHLSAYALMFEEGTAMTLLRDQGKLHFPAEEECEEMWMFLIERLEMNHYKQYEISNYSLSGYESKHNRRYWTGNPYLGLGPSAHSYNGNRIRRGNPGDLIGYLNHFAGQEKSKIGSDPFYMEEHLSDEELHEEYIMLRMRMSEGLDYGRYEELFGKGMRESLKKRAHQLAKEGLLVEGKNDIHLSRRGLMVADDVILKLLM